MAQGLVSPMGGLSDEEAAGCPVLESTGTECGANFCRALLPDFSLISAVHEQVRVAKWETKSTPLKNGLTFYSWQEPLWC